MADQEPVSELLGNWAWPLAIEHAGKTYKARLIADDLRSEWERWLRQRAWREALDVTGDAATAARVCTEMGMGKAFAWGSPLSRTTLASEDGGVTFAGMVLGCKPEVIRKMAEDPKKRAELKTLLDKVVEESNPPAPPGAKEDEGEPNPTSVGRG